ncbi:MAG: hypothetical protein GW886_00405 [Rhodobacterales bacterium]|nr:hypothetical protein [Rhodobacterales bacterium]NCT12613.1 hypothetical protein [Rhodobacterales bacterium]
MSIVTPIPPSVPLPARLALKIPVIGWIARDVLFGDKDNIWYALVILLTAFIYALATWGLPALVMTALSLVPLCFFMIVYFSKPW